MVPCTSQETQSSSMISTKSQKNSKSEQLLSTLVLSNSHLGILHNFCPSHIILFSFSIQYTFTAEDASKLIKTMEHIKTVLPIHYEGWTHFKETKDVSQKSFETSGISNLVTWATLGETINIVI